MGKISMLLPILSLVIFLPSILNAFATMGIDLGNEFIKIAIVKSGVPMEIALNKESQRKTPAFISFRNNERSFGSSAESISIKYPANAYHYIPSLIGKSINHPSVKLFLQRFPFYDLSFDEELEQLVFKQDSKVVFTIEELLAMILQNSRDVAEAYANESIKSAVITVPPYFSQAERRSVLRAAKLVDLDVMQLINEDTAVALHFGVFRSRSFNSSAQLYMFYNMGSQSTSAVIVQYETFQDGSSGVAIDTPKLSVLGVGSDSSLGITEFALKLREYFVTEFKKQFNLDVSKNNRAMMKLLKEAKRVVNILSANAETMAQVEYLMDEKDFKLKITRAQMEEICVDLYERVKNVFEGALDTAQVPLADIKEIILMGGGTRAPKVQEILLAISGKPDLGRSINSDEAAALGAVYQAAFLSPTFRVKKFEIKDFNYYPIKVNFEIPASEETGEDALTHKEAMLYSRGNPFPQRRGLSIIKRTQDMDVYVNYAGLEEKYSSDLLPSKDHPSNLTVVHLHNISETIKKAIEDGGIMKGFKVHFEIDSSGIFSVFGVDARLEHIKEFKEEDNSLNSTGTESKEALNETEQQNVKSSPTKIISLPVNFTYEILDAPTPSDKVMENSRVKLQEIRKYEMEQAALEKSKNDLESYIFNTRDRMDEQGFKEHSTNTDRGNIHNALELASQWYEDQGAETSKEDYDKQLLALKELVHPIDFRILERNEWPTAFENYMKVITSAEEAHSLLNNLVENPILEYFFTNLTTDFGTFPYDRYMMDLSKIAADHVSKVFTREELDRFKNVIKEHKDWHGSNKDLLKSIPKHVDSEVKVVDVRDKEGNLIREITTLRTKYDNNRNSIRIEVQKWITSKRNELNEQAKKDKQSTESENDKAKEEDPPTDDKTSTPRSDL